MTPDELGTEGMVQHGTNRRLHSLCPRGSESTVFLTVSTTVRAAREQLDSFFGSNRWGSMSTPRSRTLGMHPRDVLLWGLVMMTCFPGCSRDPEDMLAAANDSNIQRLANLYLAYQSRNDWRGPSDEAEFKEFLNGWNPKKLTAIGVDPGAIDELFTSSRDDEPFKVRYGIPGHIMGSDAPVVFESTGVQGKRMVGFLNMTIREVGEAEYGQLWSGALDPEQNTAATQ